MFQRAIQTVGTNVTYFKMPGRSDAGYKLSITNGRSGVAYVKVGVYPDTADTTPDDTDFDFIVAAGGRLEISEFSARDFTVDGVDGKVAVVGL
jgi:hypothetical protein